MKQSVVPAFSMRIHDHGAFAGKECQGLGELVRILEKSLDIAQADGAVDHVDYPKDGNQEIADIFNKVHQGKNHDREKFRLPGSVKVGVIMLCKSLLFIFFLSKNADDADPGIDFFHLPVDLAQMLLLAAKQLLSPGGNRARDQDADWHGQKSH